MKNKLFIGGISFDSTESSLREAFEGFGTIEELAFIKDRDTGRPKGFAFITFENQQAAETAMREMDGKDLDGRNIAVKFAEDKKRDGGGSRDRGRGSW